MSGTIIGRNTSPSNIQPSDNNGGANKAGRMAKKQFQCRNVLSRGGRSIVRNAANCRVMKGSPLNIRNVSNLPQRQASPGLPRPGARQKKPMDEPAALKQLRQQNNRQQKLEQQLTNLPAPPTDDPKGSGRSPDTIKTDHRAGKQPSNVGGSPNQRRRQEQPSNEPAALRQLRQENDLANLPSPPTGKPKGNGRPTGMMKADMKANILPSSFKGLSDYIGKITTTKDLLETFNALTYKGIKGQISSSQLSSLKGRCVGMLVKVSKDPKQADQISEVHLKKMIPDDYARRKDISHKITMNKSAFVDLQNRFDRLKKG
ncbi:hypothetical protein GZ77_21080 [Endozoicomonas montiporae]|uniref:Uncharacterized protein n=2 Tax=Endozoicomonas montiporae TaxID=1027273 RepID=A0A081N3A8_9GAMM|nr:hypothetical protein [Endozoicomonas montiporae]AMO58224.1 hypothetical protein EZMO1_4306 [Endozoicomonas montiporae CL-33]KEQ12931.1 hypothetical protein GZ77_21080 [Endozoicomonas montiporae]